MTAMTEQEKIRVLRSAIEGMEALFGKTETGQAALKLTATTQPVAAPEPVYLVSVPPNEFYNKGNGWLEVDKETTWDRTDPARRRILYTAAPAPTQQEHVMPPFAAPAGQHDADLEVDFLRRDKWTLLLTGRDGGLVGAFGHKWEGHPEHYDRVDVVAIDAACRFRAQGGNTSPESNLAAPVQAAPLGYVSSETMRLLSGKGAVMAAICPSPLAPDVTMPIYAAVQAATDEVRDAALAGAQISDDQAEHAYWQFDARRKGYAEWRGSPQSERDAFKAEYRAALAMRADTVIDNTKAEK